MHKKSKIKNQKSKGFSLIRFLANTKNLEREKAFSLIELLIVLSIVSILSFAGIASYINYSRSQTVTQMARKIVQDLRLAQSLAANNQKPDEIIDCDCVTLNSYTFSLDQINKKYTIFASCLNPLEKNCAPIKTETFTQDFDFTGFTAVKFKVLRRGIEFTPDPPAEKTLDITAFEKTKTIIVGNGGSIIIKGETSE